MQAFWLQACLISTPHLVSPAAATVQMCIAASLPTGHPTNGSPKNATALVLPHFPFCKNLGLVVQGHAHYGAGTGSRTLCRFGKQSRIPSHQEGPWTNARKTEFLPLPFHNFGLRLLVFCSFNHAFWAGPIEWPCQFLSVLCLNKKVQVSWFQLGLSCWCSAVFSIWDENNIDDILSCSYLVKDFSGPYAGLACRVLGRWSQLANGIIHAIWRQAQYIYWRSRLGSSLGVGWVMFIKWGAIAPVHHLFYIYIIVITTTTIIIVVIIINFFLCFPVKLSLSQPMSFYFFPFSSPSHGSKWLHGA